MAGCERRLNGCMQAERLKGFSDFARLRRRTCKTSNKRLYFSCSHNRQELSVISEGTLSRSQDGNTSPATTEANGGKKRGVGKASGLNYKGLVEKYLQRQTPSFLEVDERKEKMYKCLEEMQAPQLTIFLLCVETGSIAEVARMLKVHRETLRRIYNRIVKKLRNELGRL